MRAVIEEMAGNCRFIFTANRIEKIDPALQSRLFPVSFDFPDRMLLQEIASYKERVISALKNIYSNVNELRVSEIVDRYPRDYRALAKRIEFELLSGVQILNSNVTNAID